MPDLRIAFATALAVVAFAVVAVYLGSRPSVGPGPTIPGAIVTVAPTTSAETTPQPTPLSTPEPTPADTEGPPPAEPTPAPNAIKFAEFHDHIANLFNRYGGLLASHATVIEQGYGAGDALYDDAFLRGEWIDNEQSWIAERAPAECFALRFAAWADAIDALSEQARHGTGTVEELLAAWAPVSAAVEDFDTSIGLTDCLVPWGPDAFVRHVNSSIATFTPLADDWTSWVTSTGQQGSEDIRAMWFPNEITLLSSNEPAECLADRYHQWESAVSVARDAAIAMVPDGTLENTLARWNTARDAIESFNATQGFDCAEPTPTPPPVAQPQPAETPVPEVTALAAFQEHIAMQLEEFSQIAPSVDRAAAGPATGDIGEVLTIWADAYGLPRDWFFNERMYLIEFREDDCYAQSRATWETLVDDFEAFHDSITGYQPAVDNDAWTALKERFANYDPTAGATC